MKRSPLTPGELVRGAVGELQGAGRWPLHGLDRIRRDFPMALQGVSLSIEPIESRVKPL
jgi:hypothetical protein